MDTGAKMREFYVNEHISFWKWISESKLAIVSNTSVYHCDIIGNTNSARMFILEQQFMSARIFDYGVDSSGTWAYVIGTLQGEND